MDLKRTLLSSVLLSTCLFAGYSQPKNNVEVDFTVQRYLGDVSKFDRAKYINMHVTRGNDKDLNDFLDKYGVGVGRGFWGPLMANPFKSTEQYPEAKPNQNTAVKEVEHYISTEHPSVKTVKWGMDLERVGEWAVEYFNNYTKSVPAFYEPLNEPFVHSFNAQFTANQPDPQKVKETMADLYGSIAKHIKADPRLKNMKMIGYASAYPSMELHDFKHFDTNMRLFLDRAGEYMDGISVHLYDGINIRGKASRRSGSNSEAILDLVETYSFYKWGKAKPLAISEFGGIDDTYGIDFNEKNAYKVLPAVNHILFNLIERQDNMLISIPFIGDKAQWHITKENDYASYCAVTFLPNNPKDLKNTTWRTNRKEDLFKMWRGVNGDRVDIQSNNPDLQTIAFRDGETLYIAIDNLDDVAQSVDLSSVTGWKKVSDVTERAFSVADDGAVHYAETTTKEMPQSINIAKGGTTVLVAKVGGKKKYSNTIQRTKYYSRDHLVKVVDNKELTFNFNDVKAGKGRCVARMSYANDIGKEGFILVKPTIKINGTEVEMPDNWRGYNQIGRDDFFGTFEIPFDLALLNDGANKVTVTYPAGVGGRISSMILQVEKYQK